MSESNLTRTLSSPANAVPTPEEPTSEQLAESISRLPPAPSRAEELARERIAILEREAKAVGHDPAAALLFHEIGLLWEDPLKNPRNAAVAFQNAYKLSPKLVPNIRAARRLFGDVGNWQMVIQLIDAELLATDDDRTRAALLFEKGTVLEERLSREADAIGAYTQSLALQPRDLTLLIQLESVFTAKASHRALVEVYRLLAATLEDPSARAHYLSAAAFLLEERLKNPEEAAACYREAFTYDRRDLLLISAIKRIAEREGRVEELLSALASEAEVLGAQAAPTFLRISKVYQRIDRKEDALAALLAARRASPNEPLVLSALADIYQREGRFEDLADVLLSWVGSINDESEHVAINLRLAALYEEDLKRDDDAIARYKAILAKVPGHAAALASLGKLYFRNQNWDGLLTVFEAEAAAADDPKQKAAKVYKAAEVLEERLGRTEDAIGRYNLALQLQPGYLPAQKALTRLYERQGRFAELVTMYEQDLLQMVDREQIIATLNKMALFYEERLSDLDHAIDCLKRILDLEQGHLPTMRNLARLYEHAGRWRELLELHEQEAAIVGDTKQVLSLHHRNAEILDEQLKDRPGAIAAYERLLSLSPSYLPALKSLGRLYAQDGRWLDLIKMYRAEAEISPSTDQAAALIHKIGELYEQRLKDENEAIASYQEVLTLAPSYFPALRALARIYGAHGAWENLIEVLRAEAANRTDPMERANALFQAAAIWEDHLDRIPMAIEGYQEVIRITPGHATALRALERLYAQQDNTKELIAILDRETQTGSTPAAKVTAYLKLTKLYLDRLNEPSRAAQCAEAALAIDSGNVTALRLLERIRASDKARRAELKARLAEKVTDPKLRLALRLAASSEQDRAASDGGLEDLERAFQENPNDPRLFAALERSHRQSAYYARLVELYERRAVVTSDPSEKLTLTLRAAELAEFKLGQADRASTLLESAHGLNGEHLPAVQGLRRLALDQGDFTQARRWLEREAAIAKDVRIAVDALVSAGRLCLDKVGDADAAAGYFQKALERDPLDPAASAALEELLASRGGAADLASLHERRADAKLALKDLGAAAQELISAARIAIEKLADPGKAIALVNRALDAQPSHTTALELKGTLALEAGEYADAAAALSLRAQQGGDAKLLSALHLQLGALYQDRLADPSRAAAHLQTAVTGDPQNAGALDRLAALHLASRNWTGAADSLKRLLEFDLEPKDRARHTLSLARIEDEGFGDAAQASALYRRALELAPGDAAVIDRLVALYERTGNAGELVTMLEQQAQQAKDLQSTIPIRLRAAELHVRASNMPKAIATYRQILDHDGSVTEARAALAGLLMRDPGSIPIGIEEHRTLLRTEPARLESLHALFHGWQAVKQTDKAFCAAAVLQTLRSADEVELAHYNEGRNRLPQEPRDRVAQNEVDALLHPEARGPLLEVLRAIGDQLSRIHPAQLEVLGIDARKDKLKADHALSKAVRSVTQAFGVEKYDVYQARRGTVLLETTEPLSVCVGPDLVRRYQAREQKFLLGRATLGLLNKTAVLGKLSFGETTDLIGAAVRIFNPGFTLGRRNDDFTRQLKKTLSRSALRELEPACHALGNGAKLDLQRFLDALAHSANRAAILVAGDPAVALGLLLRDDPAYATAKQDGAELQLEAVKSRPELQAAIAFILSDEYFRLRQKLGMAV